MGGAIRSGGVLARIVCGVAFAVQILLPALHPLHGGVDAADAHLSGAHCVVDAWRAGAAAHSHDAQGCVLCAARAAGHAGLALPPPALVLAAPARPAVRTAAAPALVAAPLTRAAPRAPPLLAS